MIELAAVAAVEAVVFVVGLALLLSHYGDQAKAWADERRELLTRIQAPERIPMPPMEHLVQPELEPDDIELVGTIQYLDEEPDVA